MTTPPARRSAVSARPATAGVDLSVNHPPSLASELHLRNGLAVTVRPVIGGDEATLLEFLTGPSVDSRRLRFFTAAVDLRAAARLGAASDDADHHGIVALAPGRGLVGHAIYVRVAGAARAEVAVEVADDVHHLGLATLLIIRLAQLAEDREITGFFAEVLPENLDMLAVFHDRFAAITVNRRDEVDVEFRTSRWRAAHARFES